MAKDKTEAKVEKSEKPKKAKKPITPAQLAKWGIRETRFAAKIGKMLISETDSKKAEVLGEIQVSLATAGAKLQLLGKK